MTDLTEIEALEQTIRKNLEPRTITHRGHEFLLTPDGMSVEDLTDTIDALSPRPSRRKGSYSMGRIESYIDYTKRYKTADSVVFAQGTIGDVSSVRFQTVLNAHPEGADDSLAGHEDFKVAFDAPLSKEFIFWNNNKGKRLGQQDFALLLEERVPDMCDPLTWLTPEQIDGLSRNLAGKPAAPIQMLELSRGLEVRVAETVKNQTRLPSGEMSLIYSVEHTTSDGQPLIIPTWFLLNIPVFEGGAEFVIPVRLRYRISEGKTLWSYDLYRMDKTFDEAFSQMVGLVKEKTGLPVFIV